MAELQYGGDSHYNEACKNHPELIAIKNRLCGVCLEVES